MPRFYFVAIIYCLLVACCLCEENSDVNERAGGGPGFPVDKDPNDPIYRRLAEESLLQYLVEVGDLRYHKILQVTRATEQVVSGKQTTVYFLAAPTNCLLPGNVTPSNLPCTVGCKDFANRLVCVSNIWDQFWLNRREINISCARISN